MPFPKLQAKRYPPRLWALVGFPGSGKSTFATAMRSPLLVVDSDHRFTEVMYLVKDVFALSDTPEDNVIADKIAAHLKENMPGATIGTIVVDSLTAIITPLVVQAMVDHDEGRTKNLAAGFRPKALAMRQLQDAVSQWGTDVLWVYHLMDARDEKANKLVRATVSATELARLTRSINMQIEVLQDAKSGQRGIKVAWARRGRSNLTLWDMAGDWRGMPEQIEAAVYDGLTPEEQDKIENDPPTAFASPDKAVAWGFAKGIFRDEAHAKNTYDKVKREHQPKDAREMRDWWVAEVQARLEHAAAGNGEEHSEMDPKQAGLPF